MRSALVNFVSYYLNFRPKDKHKVWLFLGNIEHMSKSLSLALNGDEGWNTDYPLLGSVPEEQKQLMKSTWRTFHTDISHLLNSTEEGERSKGKVYLDLIGRHLQTILQLPG